MCEAAPHYVSQFQDVYLIRARQDAAEGNTGGQAELDVAREKGARRSQKGDPADESSAAAANKAFSLARFVPLLSERIYVLSPFTRNYLVSWITVLDSVPDLELVSYLPQFLDGLLKYLSDPNTDVRVATAKVLADFLREIQEAAETARMRREAEEARAAETLEQGAQDAEPNEDASKEARDALNEKEEDSQDILEESWIPAQEVHVAYAAIMETLLNHIAYPDEEIQATTQQWIAELLFVVREVVVPFTPRLVPAILPNIAHHSPAIQNAANVLNVNLYHVIQELPWSTPTSAQTNVEDPGSPEKKRAVSPGTSPGLRPISESQSASSSSKAGALGLNTLSLSDHSTSSANDAQDPFDLQTTVNVLTLQLIDEHEETRVAALEWLLMLHQKAPRRILSINDGTFPALLKTLSDPSEDVIRCDLRLLAQMSGASDDAYNSYLANLVSLFSTDRRLLETRGSLIIRQLCTTLHTERVFRTLAQILEKDEDLEFASIMITNLNMILITSPELADFRRRLKNLETRDGQNLFISLYRSWCHNAVASLSLCLLAQAYEHASNLLSIFPELEMTVPFLIQIDKLVQLLESPVFMTLRLQLLEPDRYPHLLKTLYGLLMLLPQSSAFATLRNRLNAVSALGYLHIASTARQGQGSGATSLAGTAGSSTGTTSGSGYSGAASSSSGQGGSVSAARSKIVGNNREDLKWNELLIHFKVVQARQERARRTNTVQDDQQTGSGAGASSHIGIGAAEDTIGGLGISSGNSGNSRHQQGSTGGAGGASSGGGGVSRVASARRRPAAATGNFNRANSAVRPGPSSVAASRLRGASIQNTSGANGADLSSSSGSFFRLPIGASAATGGTSSGGSAGGANGSGSGTATPTASSRPISPLSRRGTTAGQGSGSSAVPNLISRTMSLSSTHATQRPR